MSKITHKLSRLIYNLKKYGIFRTLNKIIKRLFKLDKKSNISDHQRYVNWISQNESSYEDWKLQEKCNFQYKPKISILVPVYNPNEEYFVDLLNSFFDQTYKNWEVCIADGSEAENEVIKALCMQSDKLKYKYLGQNFGIAGNTNAALDMAEGDFIAFSDQDDYLPPSCLYEVVRSINTNKDVELIYTDEDKIDENGDRFAPHFKPEFSITTLECTNYITHFVVMKRNLVEKIGKLDSRFDGAQDYDYLLRAVENTKNIVHISGVYYHWRMQKNSTASSIDSKLYALDAGKRALEEHLKRIGKEGIVEQSEEVPGAYKIKYKVQGNPKVSIIIPNKDGYKLLKRCIESILKLTTYNNYEIIIIENNSTDKKTFKYYDEIQKDDKIKVINYEGDFNYSKIINFGVRQSTGEFILQLNNDCKLLTTDWLEIFIGYAQNKEIGAVGARLYYEDMSIQHAGIAYGIQGTAANLLVNLPYGKHGYYAKEAIIANVSAVTGACLFSRREIYEEVGYMDEELFKVSFNDVDFCLKILEKGYLIVYNPYIELIHYESKTRGYEDTPEKKVRFRDESKNFREKWSDLLINPDPNYNKHFSRDDCNFTIKINRGN